MDRDCTTVRTDFYLRCLKNKINAILLKNEKSFYSRAFITYMDREKDRNYPGFYYSPENR